MRLLGFLFLIVLVVAGVGLYQGWLAFDTSHAAGKDDVTVSLDAEKMKAEGKAIGERIGKAADGALDKARELGRSVDNDTSELEGSLQGVDTATREVTVATGSEVLRLNVPATATLTRGKETLAFAQLRTGDRVRVLIKDVDGGWRITSIDVRT